MTGFHKRKLAKAEVARSKAKERERQERLQARREVCSPFLYPLSILIRLPAKANATRAGHSKCCASRKSLRRNNRFLSLRSVYFSRSDTIADDEDEEWQGVRTENQDNEYEDEETHATVTIIEDFDPDAIIHGSPKPPTPSIPSPTSRPEAKPLQTLTSKKTLHGSKTNVKPKEQKVRYETKDARRREQMKQRARRTEKAELAGGKAARKFKSPGAKKKHGSKR